jgi:tripartite-type tricarboxylate transporter receptor subunit TctC
VDRLQREVAQAVREADVRAQYDAQTFQIEASTPEALTALINQDVRSWTQFIRDNGITPE